MKRKPYCSIAEGIMWSKISSSICTSRFFRLHVVVNVTARAVTKAVDVTQSWIAVVMTVEVMTFIVIVVVVTKVVAGNMTPSRYCGT